MLVSMNAASGCSDSVRDLHRRLFQIPRIRSRRPYLSVRAERALASASAQLRPIRPLQLSTLASSRGGIPVVNSRPPRFSHAKRLCPQLRERQPDSGRSAALLPGGRAVRHRDAEFWSLVCGYKSGAPGARMPQLPRHSLSPFPGGGAPPSPLSPSLSMAESSIAPSFGCRSVLASCLPGDARRSSSSRAEDTSGSRRRGRSPVHAP
jgi:hypothetical protein